MSCCSCCEFTEGEGEGGEESLLRLKLQPLGRFTRSPKICKNLFVSASLLFSSSVVLTEEHKRRVCVATCWRGGCDIRTRVWVFGGNFRFKPADKTVKTERYQSAGSCSDSGLKGHMTLYTRIKLISDVWTPVCEHSDNTVNRFLRSNPSSGLQEENRLYKSCE